jgi:hypothetical protein
VDVFLFVRREREGVKVPVYFWVIGIVELLQHEALAPQRGHNLLSLLDGARGLIGIVV